MQTEIRNMKFYSLLAFDSRDDIRIDINASIYQGGPFLFGASYRQVNEAYLLLREGKLTFTPQVESVFSKLGFKLISHVVHDPAGKLLTDYQVIKVISLPEPQPQMATPCCGYIQEEALRGTCKQCGEKFSI